jgi:hypothetical protein
VIDGAFDSNVLLDFLHGDAIGILAATYGAGARVVKHICDHEFSKGRLKGLADPTIFDGCVWPTIIDDLDTNEYRMADDLTLRLGVRHRGEAETIAISFYRKLPFISRDIAALKIAYNRGIVVKTTTTLLNELLTSGGASHVRIAELAQRLRPRGINPDDILPERFAP